MWRELGKSVYTKILFGGIIAFGAVVGGVYVGYAMLGSRDGREAVPTSLPPNESIALRFSGGDAFPLEEYSDPSGRMESFDELLRDQETILILGSTTCDNCLDLLKYVHDTMPGRVKPGVQIVVVLRREWWPPIREYAGLFDNLKVALVDGNYWQNTYHWEFWPIIVGIDSSGIVQHMQYGYVRAIDRELVEFFYSTEK